jgi:hypothetical protein
VQTIKFVGVFVFEKKRFEANVNGNAFAYGTRGHDIRTNVPKL